MELFSEIVNNYLVPAFIVLVGGLLTYLADYIKCLYNEKVKNQIVQDVVERAVLYVEQKFENAQGSEKYAEALIKAESLLQEKNIQVSQEALDTLIEASVYKLTNAVKKKK